VLGSFQSPSLPQTNSIFWSFSVISLQLNLVYVVKMMVFVHMVLVYFPHVLNYNMH
jgi:hypothetical protein